MFNNLLKSNDCKIDKIINLNIKEYDDIVVTKKYEYGKELNSELGEYILLKMPSNKKINNLKLNFNISSEIQKSEIFLCVINYFKNIYKQIKNELNNSILTIIILLYLGIQSYFIFSTINIALINNAYFQTVFEIFTWVLVWEAVEIFLFKYPALKRKYKQIKNILHANIDITINT